MLKNRNNKIIAGVIVLVAVFALSAVFWSSAIAGKSTTKSTSDVMWTWGSDPVGSSKLVRNKSGLHANLSTSGLAPGQAMTFWIMFFNNPEECVAGPFNCSIEDLGADTAAQGDFHWASGHVIGNSGKASFGGSIKANDTRASGLAEFPGGCLPDLPDCGGPIGIENVDGALVVLAIHSHGPKQTGQILKSQLDSYLGGCEGFTGTLPGGFAASEDELPVNDGECATIQMSPHAPTP